MPDEYSKTDKFRGARFTGLDFRDVTFRDCDMSNLKIAASDLVEVNISGWVRNSFVVNDVDVVEYVEAELNRRYPVRAQVEATKSADDYRATWGAIEDVWSQAVTRARRLPESALQERVDEEWSLVETLRHLIFATDAWAGSAVLELAQPYHRLGLTHTDYSVAHAAAIGIDLNAKPTFDEVLVVRTERLAMVRGFVDELTAEELERSCMRPPAPGYPEQPRTVRQCIRVVMNEECEHYRYAMRDLAVLEQRLET